MDLLVRASEDWQAIMHASQLTESTGVVKFFVSGEEVAARIMPHGTPGGTAFRLADVKGQRTRNVTFYLHGVFRQHPELRPLTRSRVAILREVDVTGKPYLVINLASKLAMPTAKQDGETQGASEKTAAAKQKGKRKRKTDPATKPPETEELPEA